MNSRDLNLFCVDLAAILIQFKETPKNLLFSALNKLGKTKEIQELPKYQKIPYFLEELCKTKAGSMFVETMVESYKNNKKKQGAIIRAFFNPRKSQNSSENSENSNPEIDDTEDENNIFIRLARGVFGCRVIQKMVLLMDYHEAEIILRALTLKPNDFTLKALPKQEREKRYALYDSNRYITVLTDNSKHGTIVNKALCLELFATNQKNYLPRFLEKEKAKYSLKEDILGLETSKKQNKRRREEENDKKDKKDKVDKKGNKKSENNENSSDDDEDLEPKPKKRKTEKEIGGNLFEKMLETYQNSKKATKPEAELNHEK